MITGKKQPLLSICMPTYNRAEKSLRQLNFILHETKDMEDVEIIVSNNASSDNTDILISNMYKKFNFIYICNSTNIGIIRNIKLVVMEAKGKYIWIIGDDDIIESNTIRQIINILREKKSISGIYINTNKSQKKLTVNADLIAKEKCKKLLPIIKSDFLFITANIIYATDLKAVFNEIDINSEDSFSIPMIGQFVAARRPNTSFEVIKDRKIKNDKENISWKKQHYKLIVWSNTEIFLKLQLFGYSKSESYNLARIYFISENKRIFLEMFRHLKENKSEVLEVFFWYLKIFPITTIYLLITLPVRSAFYMLYKNLIRNE